MIVLVSALAGCGGSGGPSAGGTGPAGPSVPASQSAVRCNVSLTHDTYDGFHIPVPAGWDLTTLRGELQVAKDVSASEAVIVSPAVQTSGLTPASFFDSQLRSFESMAAAAGRPLTLTGTGSQQGIPSATFMSAGSGPAVKGEATVIVQRLPTQLSSSELDFVAYWAPQSTYASERLRLSSIVGCYGPEAASLYQVFRDQVFTYMLPPGWRVADNESQDSIDLHSASGDVGYLLAGGPASEFSTPEDLIRVFLGQAGVGSITSLWRSTGPSQPVSSGAVQSTEYEEFKAVSGGQAVHGLIFALTDSGNSAFTTGVVRYAISTAAAWNALNGGMIQMAGAIQHDFTQDLEEWQRINQQWQNFSNQEQNFDDVLNNQQLVQDPATGIYYEAPYASYDPNGPQGPGYYHNGVKLNEVERPVAPAVIIARLAHARTQLPSFPRLAFR